MLPALIRKFNEAKAAKASEVEICVTGTPGREFLHVDEVADGCPFLVSGYSDERLVNIGWGEDGQLRRSCQGLVFANLEGVLAEKAVYGAIRLQ